MPEQTKALAPYAQLKTMMTSDEIKARFVEILGKKSAGFMASVLNTVYLDNNLRDAEPNSIITAAMTAAILDLPVDRNLGFSWIIPYREGKDGPQKARFQMGYKGYVQLAIRTGQYTDINATVIYQGEEVKVDRLTGRIVLNGKRTGDEITGYVAYFRMTSGFEKYNYMSIEEVETHARKYSKSYGDKRSTWSTAPHEMGKKTVLAALLKKYGLLSIEMQQVAKNDLDFIEESRSIFDDDRTDVIDLEPEHTFDPAEALVESGYCMNLFAANSLLKEYVPEEIKQNKEALLQWAKLYRGWRDSGLKAPEAKVKADAGEVPA